MNAAGKWIIEFAFTHLIKMEWLRGHRSYVAGASSMLGGVIIVLDMVVSGVYSDERTAAAFAAITFGLSVIGKAGKSDKLIEAIKAQSPQHPDGNGV